MQFRLVEKYRYWWPVTVRMPDPDNPGAVVEQQLRIQFEALDRAAMLSSEEAYQKLRSAADRAKREHELLRAICVNWDDVVDEAGAPVAFSAEVFERALQKDWFRAALYTAYAQSLRGEAARLGN